MDQSISLRSGIHLKYMRLKIKMKYTIVQSPRPDRFEEKVQLLLSEGWSLHGGPIVSGTGQMCQALTKEEPKGNKTNAKPKVSKQT